MSPEKQQQAIRDAMCLKVVTDNTYRGGKVYVTATSQFVGAWEIVDGTTKKLIWYGVQPDFCNDLNAIACAKRQLLTTPEQQQAFLRHLFNVFAERYGLRDGAQVMVEKTASDEAAALLRTLDKWQAE